MSRLFGFFSELPDSVAPALRLAGCHVPEEAGPRGYGVAVAHGAHALLTRRPEHEGAVDLGALTEGTATNVLVANVRISEGKRSTPDTQPFRFGPWMWTSAGQLEASEEVLAELRRHLPDSLQRNVEGRTADEVLFHLFLSHLRDAGVSPKGWQAPDEKVIEAFRSTVAHWRYSVGGQVRLGALFGNAQSFYCASLGLPLRGLPLCLDPLEVLAVADGAPVSTPEAWVFTLGGGDDPGWIPFEAGELTWIGPDLAMNTARL